MDSIIILFARLAVGVGFLSAVADRFGLWGKAGKKGVAWGNWDNFSSYTSTLTFNSKGLLLHLLAYSATCVEIILGVLLVIGYKVKLAALGSGILLLFFALAMSLNAGLKLALDYSVLAAAACCFLLYLHPKNKWSLDAVQKIR